MERPLEGKTAVVTGASRDIGLVSAEGLAELGVSRIVGTYRDKAKKAAEASAGFSERFPNSKLHLIAGDLTDRTHRQHLYQEIGHILDGQVDILILSTSGPDQEINVTANQGMVTNLLPMMRPGSVIGLMQSVPGLFIRQLRGLDLIPYFYIPVAESKKEGQGRMSEREDELASYGVRFFVACPPEVPDTFNMRAFTRFDKNISAKHAGLSAMLGLPHQIPKAEVGRKVAEMAANPNLPMGYVELFGHTIYAANQLRIWYDHPEAIFVDTYQPGGIGRRLVGLEDCRGHQRFVKLTPAHVTAEFAWQTLALLGIENLRSEGQDVNTLMETYSPRLLESTQKMRSVVSPGMPMEARARILNQRDVRGMEYIVGAVEIYSDNERVAEFPEVKAALVRNES